MHELRMCMAHSLYCDAYVEVGWDGGRRYPQDAAFAIARLCHACMGARAFLYPDTVLVALAKSLDCTGAAGDNRGTGRPKSFLGSTFLPQWLACFHRCTAAAASEGTDHVLHNTFLMSGKGGIV